MHFSQITAGLLLLLPAATSGAVLEARYPTPDFPAVGACKKVAVDGAKKISKAFPSAIDVIGCKRDCACPGDSEHCCGLATDLMTSKAGVKTSKGEPLAEWIMKNRNDINLLYVIWGQKIWNPSRDKVGPWSGWRKMEDRGSVTQNHWDHVHVSYKG